VIGPQELAVCDTPRGANSSAVIYSLWEAKENGLNPLTYLTHLFEKLPTWI